MNLRSGWFIITLLIFGGVHYYTTCVGSVHYYTAYVGQCRLLHGMCWKMPTPLGIFYVRTFREFNCLSFSSDFSLKWQIYRLLSFSVKAQFSSESQTEHGSANLQICQVCLHNSSQFIPIFVFLSHSTSLQSSRLKQGCETSVPKIKTYCWRTSFKRWLGSRR
jgi:hypothetical protein